MPYKPANLYDADRKIWSGDQFSNYFDSHLSIGEIIFEEMRRHPQLIAQISATENTILTRAELHANSMRVASYMRSLGLLQSDVVGIIGRNTTHMLAVAYACFFNGIAFHSLNITYDQKTIEKIYNITKPKVIFCDGDEFEKVRAATSELDVKIVTMRNHPSDSIRIDEVLATPIEENFKAARLEQGNDQTLAILCSSGTTGIPKAVTVTNSRQILAENYHLTTADVQYSHNTLDWITGLLTTITSGVFSTTRIIADNPFDPAFALRVIKEYKVTWVIQPPSAMALMINSPEFETSDFSSIRCYMFGGSRASIEVQQSIRSRLSSDCLHFAYGFTELGAMATINFHHDLKPGSVGRLVNGLKLKIINDKGESLGPDEVGEVCVQNNQFWSGYYGNEAETRQIRDSERWYHSGDLGCMDQDGFLYIVDRKKEMLKYQNIMYYPNDIEGVISEMPEVLEVCVFGISSDIYGDEAAAAVVKKLGSNLKAQDVIDYVSSRTDSKYKQLNGGAIIVEDLKRSANGKTNRMANKAYFLEVKKRS
ncbi:LOW QUALITY PROTEIN: luciferin 4-monooxygenase-like [Drosophila ficusphila]|uniref:LOW QUALITY PROTEIN: luciferin 4-monooxygenase-like n=1 Tax=Drosophila ficusphila TaxID=30025 RepID=UPI001C8A3B75|nr:LOW QUALITY PROTEIN: luciferin 4-monooxygenase-like [Drosophila ficusphila]